MATVRVPLYRQAQEHLKQYIEAEGLAPGDSLPAEGALAERLGMSRLSLREATKSLEALGIVEARRGEGVFVRAFSFDPILDNLPYSFAGDGSSLHDLFQVRQAMEVGLGGLLLAHVRPAHLAALDALVAEMAACPPGGDATLPLDRAFHLELFRPLGNTLVLRLIELFWEAYHRLRRETHPGPPDPQRVHRIHRGIVDALRTGDRLHVVVAMDHHFAMIPTGLERGRRAGARRCPQPQKE
jgi:DNA-binding FadR family transcriptional regulator